MIYYSLDTLKWGLEQAFKRCGGSFKGVDPEHWVRTSGHPLMAITDLMEEIELEAIKNPQEQAA